MGKAVVGEAMVSMRMLVLVLVEWDVADQMVGVGMVTENVLKGLETGDKYGLST